MQLELGPIDANEMVRWTKFARRLLLEVRTDRRDGTTGGDVVLDLDVLDGWSNLIDAWQATAKASSGVFRWSEELGCEQGEYLLHGLVKGLGGHDLGALVTLDDIEAQATVTRHVLECFLDSMCDENAAAAAFTEDLRSRFLAEPV